MSMIGKAASALGLRKSVVQVVDREFGIEPVESGPMREAIKAWAKIWEGKPDWKTEDMRLLNFGKTVAEETARLTTLAASVTISGSARADWMQQRLDTELFRHLRDSVERGCAMGACIFKPTVDGISVYSPDEYQITATDSQRNIVGVVFYDTVQRGGYAYVKAEYHRYDGPVYRISNRAFRMKDGDAVPVAVSIDAVPEWVGIEAETVLENISSPLFSVFTMPGANNIDGTVCGMSIFSNAVSELAVLDIAWTVMADEIEDSKPIALLDDRLLQKPGHKVGELKVKLPRYVRNVSGTGMEEFYQQIVNSLQTSERKVGINLALSLIGYACGYSTGYFSFDERRGVTTAKQVESDDRRTIQLIKDIRDSLQRAIDGLLLALDEYADLYRLAPYGRWKADYDFGDITYSYEEDRQNFKSLCQLGVVPWWVYLVKFEGYGEDEAKALVSEARTPETGLFGAEE